MGFLRNMSFIFYGSKHFGKQGFARAKASWDESALSRRLEGKVVLVTGANQGLGFVTAQELAARGATTYMVCRNPDRGREAVERVRAATGNQDVHLQVCDVSSLASVNGLVREWEAAGRPLHVLVNNAGILVHEYAASADGHESTFATHTLGSFALTWGLGRVLAASAPALVVFVSSGGMYTSGLEVKHVANQDMAPKSAPGGGGGGKFDGTVAYSRDKRRQVAMAERFGELWAGSGVTVVSMHPGWAVTEGVKKSIPGFYNFYKDSFRQVEQGADTLVWLALQDPTKLQPGAFYLDRTVQPKHLPLAGTAYDTAAVDTLWRALEGMVAGKVTQAEPPAAAGVKG
ncbi:hypothetical protein HYH02_002679 [Chlamydomonas schloesseri]|uniref:Uncharacterized protein n=1 Tax=Chlamydomonas schloesseri TaxID=2026947 RepID=A0A836BA81_9CHLO|nr:hypothetical protein HYH02_002679 [Chlamydomonas schloesseri]|eukprot:KAG2452436.1 hypothetical protein HYH02_002679 [Chlamydomonas schloesseri]